MKYFILCVIVALALSKSPCEESTNVKGFKDCKGKQAEEDFEICCYCKSIMDFEPNTTFYTCVDIIAEDVKTKKGKEDVIKRIENGTYWDSYHETGRILELECSAVSTQLSLFMIMVIALLF